MGSWSIISGFKFMVLHPFGTVMGNTVFWRGKSLTLKGFVAFSVEKGTISMLNLSAGSGGIDSLMVGDVGSHFLLVNMMNNSIC